MEKNTNFSEFLKILESYNEKLLVVNNSSDIHALLKELFRVIQQCPINVPHPGFLNEKHQRTFLSFMEWLLIIITDIDHPAEVSFLSSTCLSSLLSKMFDAEFSCAFLIYLYHLIANLLLTGEKKAQSGFFMKSRIMPHLCKAMSDAIVHCRSINNLCFNDVSRGNNSVQEMPKFPQLSLLHGIVSCQQPKIFLCRLNSYENLPFIISMFNAIYLCCITPCNAQFHAFSTFLSWMRMCRHYLSKFHSLSNGQKFSESYFSLSSKILNEILTVLEANWESPIQGVTGMIKEIYRILLELCEEESKITGSDIKFVIFLLERTMKLSWKVKGKYLVLSAILQDFECEKFLEQYPDSPSLIISNLKANYASSAIGEVYKAIVSNMKKTTTVEELPTKWCQWWKDPVVAALISKDKLLIQNIRNIILPWTMKTIPDLYELLFEAVKNESEPKIMLLRIAKESGICSLNARDFSIIKENLHHYNMLVRMEIFTTLCSSPKKSEPVSFDVLMLIKEFILLNLNIDSAAYHQRLLAQLKILLIRIRDSSVQEYRLKAKTEHAKLDLSQLEFVNWLAHTAIENTFPGACFQRRRLCLQILNVTHDVFIVSPQGQKKKEKPSESVKLVIKCAQDQQLLLFLNDCSILNILHCITDFTDEIRVLTANLLQEFCEFLNESFLDYALKLCNNPDVRHSDSGAHLCRVIFIMHFNMDKKKCCLLQSSTPLDCSDSFSALLFLQKIYNMARLQLHHAKNNFVEASSSEPVHGLLLALHHCTSGSKDFYQVAYKNLPTDTLLLIENIILLCDETVKHMLFVMRGNDQKNTCPSFAEIGQALDDLILSKEIDGDEAKFANKNPEQFETNCDASLSAEFDLLLSCCWHNIKNSCFLLSELSVHIFHINIDLELKQRLLQRIATILSSTLLKCRHRGVVDACNVALGKFCKIILSYETIYEEIPFHILKVALSSLTDAALTSVTRRSAGLPLIFQAVISSEKNNINRKLLSFSLEKLLDLISLPLPTDISEKTDLPQAHAHHILKVLVTDSSLSQGILCWLDHIVPACVSGFSSPCWAIRNGALQLFGVLIPRLCGQKKVREDDSEHNLVSSSELFTRCPGLHSYLFHQLKNSANLHKKKQLCPELVPLLSLVAKLLPQQEENDNKMKDFKPLLLELLDSPVWNVRSLVSIALSPLLSCSDALAEISDLINILSTSRVSCNKIHGLLLTVQNVLGRSMKNLQNVDGLLSMLNHLSSVLQKKVRCSIIHGVLADIVLMLTNLNSTQRKFLEFPFLEGAANGSQVGYYFFQSKATLKDLSICEERDLPVFIKHQLEKDQYIQKVCLKFLSKKLLKERATEDCYNKPNLESWKQILLSIVNYIEIKRHPSIINHALNFMIYLCSDWKYGSYILDFNTITLLELQLQPHLEMKTGLSVAASSLTLWSLCLKASLQDLNDGQNIGKWNLIFNTYCYPRSSDILRMQAAESVSVLGPSLVQHLALQLEKGSESAPSYLIGLCEGSLRLLQDEDEEVRNKTSMFVSNIPHDYKVACLQFNVALRVVCQLMTDYLQSHSNFLLYLWNKLQNFPSTAKILLSYSQTKKNNLFEQEYVNVYAEPVQLLLLYEKHFIYVMKNLAERNYQNWIELLEMFMFDIQCEIEDIKAVLQNIGQENIAMGFTWQHQVYLSLKKINSQVKAIQAQKPLLLFTSHLNSVLQEIVEEWNGIINCLPNVPCSLTNSNFAP